MKKVKRTRKYNGKTTTGCVTCKMRRVKCDEGQPNCHRCQSTGRKCDGYSQTKECSKQNIFSLAPLELGEEAEREAFHFFRRQTVRKSAIYFESDFWNRLVLQLCHSEPVIRHAVVALGSLHQRFELTNSVEDGEENSIALHRYTRLQYSKAIAGTHDLVNQNKENALDLTLVVCVLFVCLENFLGDFEAAEIHLDNGFKILANRQHNHQKTPSSTLSIFKETSELLEDDILHQFTRLELQATTFQGDRYREPLVYYNNMMIPLVKHFDCLNVARNELYITLVRLLRLRNAIEGGSNPLAGEQSTDSPDQLMKMIQECSAHLEYWKTAFSRFLERNSSTMDIKTLRAALLLKAHHMLGTVGIAVDQVEGTGGEDAFIPQMDEILSWTESATKGMDGEQSPHTAEFSFELGVIMPLYCVASSCRKPSSRRRAVELLKATPRREGLWDNLAAAAVAQRIIDVEEEGLGEVQYASDIPPSSRVYQTEVDLSFDQRRVDARFTFMPFGRDGPIIERKEVITW